MENTKNLFIDAKKAAIGGIIALVLSPISILLAYYLGQQLEKPKLSIANIEQKFEVVDSQGKNKLLIPDSLSSPVKGNPDIMIYSDIEADEFDYPLNIDDAEDMVRSLKNVKSAYENIVRGVNRNISKIESWDGKSELILEVINPQLTGGESIYNIVKKSRRAAIEILKGIKVTLNNRATELYKVINFITPFAENKMEKKRTGEVKFLVGILNSGKTDAVIFPESKIIFKNNEIYYTAKNNPNAGYTVINSHSFKQIPFIINLDKGDSKNIEEWKSMIINHANTDFKFICKPIEESITLETHLESK